MAGNFRIFLHDGGRTKASEMALKMAGMMVSETVLKMTLVKLLEMDWILELNKTSDGTLHPT